MVGNSFDRIEGNNEPDSGNCVNYNKEKGQNFLDDFFDDSKVPKRKTEKIKARKVRVPYPFARFGSGFDEKDVNKYLNKYILLQIAFEQDTNSKWFDEIIDENQTKPKKYEIKREEFLYFTSLAALGYFKALACEFNEKEDFVPTSLDIIINETRDLIKDLALSATKKYNPGLTEDPKTLMDSISYKVIDTISDLFKEKFSEKPVPGELPEKGVFYLAMKHPLMEHCISQIENLANFEKPLNIGRYLSRAVNEIQTELMVNKLRKEYGIQQEKDNQ